MSFPGIFRRSEGTAEGVTDRSVYGFVLLTVRTRCFWQEIQRRTCGFSFPSIFNIMYHLLNNSSCFIIYSTAVHVWNMFPCYCWKMANLLIYLHNFLKENCMFGVYQICLIKGIDSAFLCVVKIHLCSLFRITFQVLYGVFGFRKHHHKMLNILLTEKKLRPFYSRIFANYFSDCFLGM